MSSGNSPKSNLIRGAIWTVGTRWLIKAMGFINTVIMARLLVPEDYGIVAMGMLTVGLIQAFLEFSSTLALLRKQEVTRDEIDSAWTLRLIQGCLAGLIISLSAPLAAGYFEEPRLLEVLWTFAACVVIASGSNIAQTLALKEFDYTLDFKVTTLGKLASVIATIGFGLILGDYRALALGIVVGYLTPFILSYVLHAYRPRWNTRKIGEIWGLTKWLLVSNIGGFLMRKSDELLAGRVGTTTEFGLYNVGSDLGQLPVAEVGPAMQRAILPVLATIKDDLERTRRAVLKTLSAIATVIWPIGLGFAALSHEATELILGSKWLAASSFVAIFAVTGALQASGGPLRSFLTLLGFTKAQSTIAWLEFFSFLAIAALLVPDYHLLGLAYARLLSSLLNALYLAIAVHRHCQLKFADILKNSYRPVVLSIAMYLLVTTVVSEFDSILLKLLTGTLVGAIFYTPAIIFSWHFSGHPEGLESTIFDKIKQIRNRT